MLIKKHNIVLYISLLFLFGCPPATNVPNEPDNPVTPGGGGVAQVSDLFVNDPDTGNYIFETNNPTYKGDYGYTLWTDFEPSYTQFTHLNVTVNKLSGVGDAGFGVVFGSMNQSCLVLLIDINQNYLVGELNGIDFERLIDWTPSFNLNSGRNIANNIDIAFDEINNEFIVKFNNVFETTFRDDQAPFHYSGKSGFISIVSPRENFPQEPVKIIYKQN